MDNTYQDDMLCLSIVLVFILLAYISLCHGHSREREYTHVYDVPVIQVEASDPAPACPASEMCDVPLVVPATESTPAYPAPHVSDESITVPLTEPTPARPASTSEIIKFYRLINERVSMTVTSVFSSDDADNIPDYEDITRLIDEAPSIPEKDKDRARRLVSEMITHIADCVVFRECYLLEDYVLMPEKDVTDMLDSFFKRQ